MRSAPCLEVSVQREDLLLGSDTDAGLGVLAHALLEEIGLALERDHIHPVERVGRAVDLGHAQRLQQAVGAELNVLAHERRVHADELHGQRVLDELLLDGHGVADDLVHARLGQLVDDLGVHEAREVAVQALVATDELVREAQTGHEPALLEPEDGAERAREEDALHGREGQDALGVGRGL